MLAQKMKIAVWSNLPTGGARRALHDHVKGLVARGHHVEAWSPPVVKADWMPLPCKEHIVDAGIISDSSNYLQRVIKHIARPTLAMKAMERHSEICAEQMKGFDVLFANTCCQYHSPFIGRFFAGPKVLYLQEPNRFLYEALPRLAWLGPEPGASWRRRLRGIFDAVALRRQAQAELYNAKQFDQILVNSYFSRESVARCYGINSSVCYLGVDTDHFVPGEVPREPFVLGVGACVYPKRVLLAIAAVAAMERPVPKLVWSANHIDPNYAQQCRELAAATGVEFELRELLPDADVLSLMHRATALIYTPRLEPFGYVPLEAAAAGCPVVTVAEGGLRETMTDGLGWIRDPIPTELGGALNSIFAEPGASFDRVRAAREGLVAKWNLEAGIDRLEGHLISATHS